MSLTCFVVVQPCLPSNSSFLLCYMILKNLQFYSTFWLNKYIILLYNDAFNIISLSYSQTLQNKHTLLQTSSLYTKTRFRPSIIFVHHSLRYILPPFCKSFFWAKTDDRFIRICPFFN
jgi:hypothetical protein